jgi:FdhD protein
MIQNFKITRLKEKERELFEDSIVEEIPFTLKLNEKELVTLLCTPADLEDLTIGFLFTSGIINKAEDIKKITLDSERWISYTELVNKNNTEELVFKRLYTSGCGRGILFYNVADIANRVKIISDLRIHSEKINILMADFQKKSKVYRLTGGTHSAALADGKGILIFREDIGRHNAIDKVIGYGLRHGYSFKNKIIITSGRISSEVLLKIQKCRIPVVVSRSAPTNQAVMLAKDMNITLVGFARGNRMNIYSSEERIET